MSWIPEHDLGLGYKLRIVPHSSGDRLVIVESVSSFRWGILIPPDKPKKDQGEITKWVRDNGFGDLPPIVQKELIQKILDELS